MSINSVSAENVDYSNKELKVTLLTTSEKDDTITQRFKVQLDNASYGKYSTCSVGVSYFDVSISGENGVVTGTVKRFGSKPVNTSINIYLQSRTTGGSYVNESKALKQTFSSKSVVNVSKRTGSKTKFWRVYVTGKLLGKAGTKYSTYDVLMNKKASRYPTYYEVVSGKKMWVPPTNLKVNKVKRSSDFRKKYLADYQKKYPLQYNSIIWSLYEIHHMQPLKYGGKNILRNGIALTKFQHRVVTTWWASY